MTSSEIANMSRNITRDYAPHGRFWDAESGAGEIALFHLYHDILQQIAHNDKEPEAQKLARAAIFVEV